MTRTGSRGPRSMFTPAGRHVARAFPPSSWSTDTPYELELLALEVSGNQTITSLHFKTK